MPSPPPEGLDAEIASLQSELTTLRKTLKIECSTILSSPTFPRRPKPSKPPPSKLKPKPPKQLTTSSSSSTSSSPTASHSHSKPHSLSSSSSSSSSANIHSIASLHASHAQHSLYRIATAVTAFKVRDPDPRAVDNGRVLVLRFEVMARGGFLAPYYVMLNRPFAGPGRASWLRLHRHTVPPAVPITGLAGRFLPPPPPPPTTTTNTTPTATTNTSTNEPENRQDIDTFVRRLRREIIRHHNRLGAAADLKRALLSQQHHHDAADVAIADVEGKQLKLTWQDDRHGRIVMDDDGRVSKAIVFGAEGRDWDTARRVLGECAHVDDIVKMLEGEE